MGVHRERLRATRAHRLFGAGIKTGVQKWALKKYGREIPVAAISPRSIDGVKSLSIPVPPMLEEALGYRGALRFVEFGYSARTHEFGFCDGGDHIPSNSDLWIQFLRHPAITPHLPKSRYPTLYGVFSRNQKQAVAESMAKGSDKKGRYLKPPHRLLLDRKQRQVYLCRTDHTTLFFALTEPENKDRHRIYVDGLLMDPGCEDYKAPPRKELAAELTAFLDGWLDASFESRRFGTQASKCRRTV